MQNAGKIGAPVNVLAIVISYIWTILNILFLDFFSDFDDEIAIFYC